MDSTTSVDTTLNYSFEKLNIWSLWFLSVDLNEFFLFSFLPFGKSLSLGITAQILDLIEGRMEMESLTFTFGKTDILGFLDIVLVRL